MARKKGTKVVDKWKSKKWYSVMAPDELEGKKLADVIATDPEQLINRVVKVPLSDISGKMDKHSLYTTVKLRIKSVSGDTAKAELIGHTMSFAYIKSLARRRRSVIHEIIDSETKDNRKVRIKAVLVTRDKVSAIVKKNLRKALHEQLIKSVKGKKYYELASSVFSRGFSEECFKATNPINPVEAIEIRRMELAEEFKNV